MGFFNNEICFFFGIRLHLTRDVFAVQTISLQNRVGRWVNLLSFVFFEEYRCLLKKREVFLTIFGDLELIKNSTG